MFLQPFFRGEPFEGGGELVVDLCPRLLEISGREGIGMSPVRIGDVDIVEFGMKAFAQAEQREHAIVHGSQVADKIEQAIAAGGDPLLKLLLGEWRYAFAEATDDKLPGIECGGTH